MLIDGQEIKSCEDITLGESSTNSVSAHEKTEGKLRHVCKLLLWTNQFVKFYLLLSPAALVFRFHLRFLKQRITFKTAHNNNISLFFRE